jgi:hypothetical protein
MYFSFLYFPDLSFSIRHYYSSPCIFMLENIFFSIKTRHKNFCNHAHYSISGNQRTEHTYVLKSQHKDTYKPERMKSLEDYRW